MKTEEEKEEKEERMNKAGMEVIELLGGKYPAYGQSIITLTKCLALLIASNPDKRTRHEMLMYALMSLTEMVETFEEAIEAGTVRMPEEGGGE